MMKAQPVFLLVYPLAKDLCPEKKCFEVVLARVNLQADGRQNQGEFWSEAEE
jgi:hypothetical protein